MSRGRCTLHTSRSVTNSCRVVHGDACGIVHVNSREHEHANQGVIAHRNSCAGAHAHYGDLQTKPLKRSSLVWVGCPTVDIVQGRRGGLCTDITVGAKRNAS